eukprot:scaffold7358_cov252-Pinguiococcus_pyrenoidosus.AAC.9
MPFMHASNVQEDRPEKGLGAPGTRPGTSSTREHLEKGKKAALNFMRAREVSDSSLCSIYPFAVLLLCSPSSVLAALQRPWLVRPTKVPL